MSAAHIRFRPSPDAVATRADNEIVIVDLKTDQIYSLNRTAARIWELFCADHDRLDVERRMLDEFIVEPEALRDAIDEVIESLTQKGLLEACR